METVLQRERERERRSEREREKREKGDRKAIFLILYLVHKKGDNIWINLVLEIFKATHFFLIWIKSVRYTDLMV